MSEKIETPEEVYKSTDDLLKKIIKRVLVVEKENIFLQRPRITEELTNIFKEEIR